MTYSLITYLITHLPNDNHLCDLGMISRSNTDNGMFICLLLKQLS